MLWPTKLSKDETLKPIVDGPIAELYPETTVMFADIKGFTHWSADRQPTQVFHLLETLYGAFDALARTCGVFKVETIGDTYVAVVGLPTPRKQHAVIMVRFAKKCLIKMAEELRNLVDVLGPVRNICFFFICVDLMKHYTFLTFNSSLANSFIFRKLWIFRCELV
jgi:class 3 adenylate cyclase